MTRQTRALQIPDILRGLLVVVLGVTLHGCSTDSVKVPGLAGPAGLGLNFQLTVSPDVLLADGTSTASVRVSAIGPSGAAAGGIAFTFLITDSTGAAAAIGNLSSSSATTDSNGQAHVIYTAPARTDATANQTILIKARPVTGDAASYNYQDVKLELRNPEPPLFPQNPNNKPPNCAFIFEPAGGGGFPGHQVLFQDTSSDPDGFIVRYQWDFGDGTEDVYDPDVNHVFAQTGTYSVNHWVTDNNGAQTNCAQLVTVAN